MRDDSLTTVAELRELVVRFRDERDWKRFHNPKDSTRREKPRSGRNSPFCADNCSKAVPTRLVEFVDGNYRLRYSWQHHQETG